MTRKQWALRQMCLATELGARIEFCGLNDSAVWCIYETGNAYSSPWRCAREYLQNEHGIRVERDGTITKVPKGEYAVHLEAAS